jgi:hypothetical protein
MLFNGSRESVPTGGFLSRQADRKPTAGAVDHRITERRRHTAPVGEGFTLATGAAAAAQVSPAGTHVLC